ncbi:hypothetical protein SNK03_005924 [Fusarium graminearum]
MCNITGNDLNTSSQTKMTRRRTNRAKRACLSCRSRKVRCDVTRQSPCSNCKWNTTECAVIESRKSPVRKKRRVHERQKLKDSQDDTMKNSERSNVNSSSLSSGNHTLKQTEDENLTALQRLRDFVNNEDPPIYQFAQVDLPEHYCAEADKKGDAMEWAFLEDPPMSTKTATSFVDSGFHDESWYVLDQAAVTTPPSPSFIYADKHKLDTPVRPTRTDVTVPGDDLLDNLFALPFDCLRHI